MSINTKNAADPSVTETTNEDDDTSDHVSVDSQLLPVRHSGGDLFICDVADAVLKDLIPQMEHPFYSLSKKPETSIRKYEHNGNWIQITPSVKGLATIYDKDILIYCISQLMEKLKRNERVSQRIRITAYDLLIFTNRGSSGRDYDALCEAIDRLSGTRITTNIQTGDEEQRDSFALIDSSSIRRKNGLDGRLLWMEIKLSDWVFNAIRSQEVLTLHPDYFRLRKPLERRIYELARKHCGKQPSWQISLGTLLKKSGSQSPEKRFRQMVKHLARYDHLPDYHVTFDEDADKINFFRRDESKKHTYQPSNEEKLPQLSSRTLEEAREIAPGYDIYSIEQDWRHYWEQSGKQPIRDPDKAFLGFCRSRYKQHQASRAGAKKGEASLFDQGA
ncbi:MAG: replication initiator protein A [Alphaproteobacteria bacterium]|nr:replication initiator protein A [Alphaproteobacteria bacterium]